MLRSLDAQKPGCPEAWMLRSLDVQKPGCSEAWMLRCLVAQESGCLMPAQTLVCCLCSRCCFYCCCCGCCCSHLSGCTEPGFPGIWMPLCQPKYLAVLAYAIAAAAVHTISAAAAAAYLHCSPGYWRPCPGPDHLPADGEGPGVAGGVHHARARPPGGPAGWDYQRARGRGASVKSHHSRKPQDDRISRLRASPHQLISLSAGALRCGQGCAAAPSASKDCPCVFTFCHTFAIICLHTRKYASCELLFF